MGLLTKKGLVFVKLHFEQDWSIAKIENEPVYFEDSGETLIVEYMKDEFLLT